jgi:hypothetical protein
MAAKKKKRVAYNPLQPYGTHSLEWLTSQANARAAADANAAIGALPSSSFYTTSAAQLGNALKGIQGNQTQVAAAGGGLYQKAFQDASAAANRAAVAGGGPGVAATPGGSSLVSALGATMAQALAGGQNAAIARGRNDVLDRAQQVSAIKMKQQSAANDYLKQEKDTALQAAVANFNNQLASSQFGLQSQNTAFDNQIAAGQLSVAQQNAATRAAADANRQTTASKNASKKERAQTIKDAQASYTRWTRPVTKVTGYTYTFHPPPDKQGHQFPAFSVIAPNGPAGLALAVQHMTAAGVGGLTGTKVGSWLTGTKANTGSAPGMDPNTAYVRARNLLVRAGFSMKEAQQIMRGYTGRKV